MKNTLLIGLLGVGAVGAGAGLIVAADRLGWMGPSGDGASVAADLCRHQLAEDRCPFCTPSLVESMGMCGGHKVPEALCTRCNASLVRAFQMENDWCGEHGLPESQCLICNPPAPDPEGSTGDESPGLTSISDRSPEAVPRDQRAPSSTCTNAFSTVTLASPEVARLAGLQTQVVRAQAVTETVDANVEIAFDGGRYAHLASRAAGIVARVNVDLGETVQAGDVLALIDSAEFGMAKAAFLQARSLVDLWEKNHARERSLMEKSVATERDVLEAETKLVECRIELSNASQRLRNLGLSEADIAAVAATGDTSSHLPLTAPFPGVVVDRAAVMGEVIDTARPLFSVADTSSMWAMLDVYESDVARLERGQRVRITIEGLPGRTIEGSLTWISAHVDHRTRTIKARAEIANPGGVLRANMFGRASVEIRTIENAVLVPEAAVQWDGCCNIVFVRHTDTIYQPYKVTLGFQRDGYFVVEQGLPPGEAVVTQGSFLLKTEILKGNIGAGCCEVDPGAAK